MVKQPEALRLAETLDWWVNNTDISGAVAIARSAAELRRLHLVNAELLSALQASRQAMGAVLPELRGLGLIASEVIPYIRAHSDAMQGANAAIALATTAPSTLEG